MEVSHSQFGLRRFGTSGGGAILARAASRGGQSWRRDACGGRRQRISSACWRWISCVFRPTGKSDSHLVVWRREKPAGHRYRARQEILGRLESEAIMNKLRGAVSHHERELAELTADRELAVEYLKAAMSRSKILATGQAHCSPYAPWRKLAADWALLRPEAGIGAMTSRPVCCRRSSLENSSCRLQDRSCEIFPCCPFPGSREGTAMSFFFSRSAS